MLPNRKSDLNQESFQFNPLELYTNSTCKIVSSFRHRAIPLSIQWFRVSAIKAESLVPLDLNTYQCSPLDLGCFIEARIVYKTDTEGKCIKTRGPVMMDPEVQQMISLEKVSIDTLKAATSVEGQEIPMNFKLKPDVLSINCNKSQNCQYLMKLEALPQFKTKPQTHILTFSVKNYSDIITKYFAAVLKRQPKTKITEFDVKFESRLHRDLFLVILNKKLIKMPLFRVPLSQQQSPFVHPPISNPTSQHTIPSTPGGISTGINSGMNSGFTYHNLIPSSTRLNSNGQTQSNQSSNPLKVASESTQNPKQAQTQMKQLRQTFTYVTTPELKTELDSLFSNQPPKRQKQYLNIFEDSVLSDDEKEMNLQNSFILYQSQKQIASTDHPKSLKTSSINDKPVVRSFQDAQKRIDQLMSDNYLLKQQNKSLNMQLIDIKSNKKVDLMKQKIKILEEDNSKLLIQKNKLAKDCSNYQIKFNKQETEKMIMKEMLESLKSKLKDQNDSMEMGYKDKEREKSKQMGNEGKGEKKREGSPSGSSNNNSSAYKGGNGERVVIGGGFSQGTGARVYTHLNKR